MLRRPMHALSSADVKFDVWTELNNISISSQISPGLAQSHNFYSRTPCNTLMEPSISLQELQKHNKVDDAWIVISGKVLLLKVLLTINLFYCKMLIFAYGRSKQSNCMPVSFSKRQINVLTVPEWGFFVWLAIEAYNSSHNMLFFM